MKPFEPAGGDSAARLCGLPWLSPDLRLELCSIVSAIVESFPAGVARIGLYGSWQRGLASADSDVDLAVFLAHEVSWFDAERGIIDPSAARRDKQRWHAFEKRINDALAASGPYSIAVVTKAMLTYYWARGPIHLQNWVVALTNCYTLWKP